MSDFEKKLSQLERVNIIVTKHCNLNCRMCDFKKFYKFTWEPSLEKIKSIIKDARELGAQTVELSGGEPMTRKDIYEIVSFASSLGMKVMMISNGVLIGEEQAQKLLKAGLGAVSFSLEGPEPLNNVMRGTGNYQKTLNAIKVFLSHRDKYPEFKVSVGITLSKFNFRHIVDFSKYLLEEAGADEITINPFTSVMLNEKSKKEREEEFVITNELIPDLKTELVRLKEYAGLNPGKLPPLSYLDRIPDYFEGKKLIPEEGCSVPSTYCAVTANGWIFSCWQNSPLGNIKNTSIKEALSSKSQKEFVESAMKGKCAGCLSSCYAEVHN